MKDNKFYAQINLSEHREILSNHVLSYNNKEYLVPDSILESISRQSGVSSTMTKILSKNRDLLIDNIIAGCDYYYGGVVTLLVQDRDVVRVSFNKNLPLLNNEFVGIMESMLEDYSDFLTISSTNFDEDSFTSEMTIYPTEEFTYNNNSYNLGVLFENDELDTVSCRLVVKRGNLEFYLPVRYFNLSASRYMRTSVDMKEALRQLVLKIVESMSNRDRWFVTILDVDMHLRDCAKIHATYEEYRSVVRLLNQISTDSDMDVSDYEDMKESLESNFLEDFIENYPAIDEKKGSYIWRCSALGDSTIYDILEYVNTWRLNKLFYPSCDKHIMYLVGEFIMLDRISTNLARRKQ